MTETMEMAEARTLVASYYHHERKSGTDEARAWLQRALVVSMRIYGGAPALERIRGYMSIVKRDELCL